jgi:hypothetical protein
MANVSPARREEGRLRVRAIRCRRRSVQAPWNLQRSQASYREESLLIMEDRRRQYSQADKVKLLELRIRRRIL